MELRAAAGADQIMAVLFSGHGISGDGISQKICNRQTVADKALQIPVNGGESRCIPHSGKLFMDLLRGGGLPPIAENFQNRRPLAGIFQRHSPCPFHKISARWKISCRAIYHSSAYMAVYAFLHYYTIIEGKPKKSKFSALSVTLYKPQKLTGLPPDTYHPTAMLHSPLRERGPGTAAQHTPPPRRSSSTPLSTMS